MLVGFTLENVLSYKEKTKFSMISGSTFKKKERLFDACNFKILKFSAIYGSNASGKSNLFKAMSLMKKIITSGSLNALKSREFEFKLDSESKNKPSLFEVQLYLKGKNYLYGFEILMSELSIQKEWLIDLDKEGEGDIFRRNTNNNEFFFSFNGLSDSDTSRIKTYVEDSKIEDKKLFLNLINEKKEVLKNDIFPFNEILLVYNWFSSQLTIVSPNQGLTRYDTITIENKCNEIKTYLKNFDTGIDDIQMRDIDPLDIGKYIDTDFLVEINSLLDKTPLNEKNNVFFLRAGKNFWSFSKKDGSYQYKRLVYLHNGVPFMADEESDGTVRVLDLIEVLISDEEDKVFLIDELDRCLHPLITIEFVKTFLKNSIKKNNQLIVTTHESRLMVLDYLRRDEIWFVEKNNGKSVLYSLEDFNVRFDKRVDKAYLEGIFGGIPKCLQEESE